MRPIIIIVTAIDLRISQDRTGLEKITESHSKRDIRGASPGSTSVLSLPRRTCVLLFTIILMSVGVAGSAGADLPPDLVDDGRGSYEMVDILAIAKRVVYGARDASTRSVSPVSLHSLLRNKLPLSCAVLVSARHRERTRCCNEREYPPSALGRPLSPSSREPPSCVKY